MIDPKRIPSDGGGVVFFCSFCVISRVLKKWVICFFGKWHLLVQDFFGAIKKSLSYILYSIIAKKGAVELMGVQFREDRPVENGYNGGKKGKGKSKAPSNGKAWGPWVLLSPLTFSSTGSDWMHPSSPWKKPQNLSGERKRWQGFWERQRSAREWRVGPENDADRSLKI